MIPVCKARLRNTFYNGIQFPRGQCVKTCTALNYVIHDIPTTFIAWYFLCVKCSMADVSQFLSYLTPIVGRIHHRKDPGQSFNATVKSCWNSSENVSGLLWGLSTVDGDSPHKWPVMWKAFPCSGTAIEVWKWMNKFIPQFTGHMIIYPCRDQIQFRGGPLVTHDISEQVHSSLA